MAKTKQKMTIHPLNPPVRIAQDIREGPPDRVNKRTKLSKISLDVFTTNPGAFDNIISRNSYQQKVRIVAI